MSVLTDNFNDNTRDTAKWALGTVIFENAGVGVAEANQQLEITPIANEISPAIYGYKSAITYDFSGLEARVRLVENFGAPSEAWLVVALDIDNYFRIWAVGGGNIFTRSRVATLNTNEDHGVFTFATHTYWKIRHDKTTDEIIFEYSPDGLSWTQLRRIARPFSITAATIYLSGGSGASSATPPVIKFDDLVVQGAQSPALFRGRNFSFFDDDEVNRFEFWAAIPEGVTVHDRSFSLSAAGSIESAAESFSVFERASSVSATGAIESAAQFYSILERSTTVDAAGVVIVTGERVVERSSSVSSAATITVSGESFSVAERAASVSATGSIETSGVRFSVAERTVSLNSTGTGSATGLRVVERAVSLTTTATITTSAESFSILERSVAISATATIETSAQFFSILERSAVIDGLSAIVVNGQTEHLRQVQLNATASITISGDIIPPGAVEHERSVTLTTTGEIASSAISFSIVEGAVAVVVGGAISASGLTVRERSAAITATTTVSIAHQRDLHRAVSAIATATISVSGVVSGPEGAVFERTVSLSSIATIVVSRVIQRQTPLRRTFVVSSGQRTVVVEPDNREYLVSQRSSKLILQ